MSESAKKNDQGKLRYDLIPPECLRELAHVYTIGARKYADDNWKNGLERKRIEAALFRHNEAARSGEVRDPEDGQRHLASVAWCAFSLMWYDIQEEEDDARDVARQIEEAGRLPDDHALHLAARRKWDAAAISSEHDEVAKTLDRLPQSRAMGVRSLP